MNRIVIALFFIIICLFSNAQRNNSAFSVIKTNYLINKTFWMRGSLFYVSGASDGWAEALRYHYTSFKKVFPNSNDQYWDPNKSWTNKYKNGDPKQGEKFWGSTTIFVGATDGFHLMREIRNKGVIVSVIIPIGCNKKKKWFEYGFEIISSSLFYGFGFTTTYDVIF